MIVLRVFCSFAGTISSLLDHLLFSFISLSPVNSWPSSRCSIDIILLEMPSLITPNMSVPPLTLSYGLPWWLRWYRMCLQSGRPGFDPWVRKIPWRRKWQPPPVFLPGKSHGQKSLSGYNPWGHKESGTTEWLTLTFTLSYTILWSTVALSSYMFRKLKMQLLFGLLFDQCQTPPVDCKLLEFIFSLLSSSPLYLLCLAKSLCLVGVQEIVFLNE